MFIKLLLIVFICLGFCAANQDFAQTPIGLIPKHCFHEVPSGSHVVEGEDYTLVKTPTTEFIIPKSDACSLHRIRLQKRQFPRDYDGWLTFTTSHHPPGYTAFYGNMSVPTTSPEYAPQVLYIFTGLQNIDWIPKRDPLPNGPFDIIQPVLQYPAQSGFGWSVRSWYVTLDTGVIVSDEIPVSQGEVFYSVMKKISGTKWVITASNKNGQKTTIYPDTPRLAKQPWAYNTVECYGCRSCSYEPTSPSFFTQLILNDENGKVIDADWQIHGGDTICKESATVVSPGAVTFKFQGN